MNRIGKLAFSASMNAKITEGAHSPGRRRPPLERADRAPCAGPDSPGATRPAPCAHWWTGRCGGRRPRRPGRASSADTTRRSSGRGTTVRSDGHGCRARQPRGPARPRAYGTREDGAGAYGLLPEAYHLNAGVRRSGGWSDVASGQLGDGAGFVGVELDPSPVALDGSGRVVVPSTAAREFGAHRVKVAGTEVRGAGGGDGFGERELAVID